jgi:hypothetical protein
LHADTDDLDEGEDAEGEATIGVAAAAAPVVQYPNAAMPGIIRPGIVHRLDRGTSGLLVVAKNDLAHMRLCEQFKARTVRGGWAGCRLLGCFLGYSYSLRAG